MKPITCETTGEIANSYQAYLKTKHWTGIRWDMKDERCFICDRKQHSIHHRNYDNLGHEEPEDLMVLCGKHHMYAHDIKRSGRTKPQRPPSKKALKRRRKRLKRKLEAQELRQRNEGISYSVKRENGLLIKVYPGT